MRWDCGEELAEKKARLEEWHRSFAWWPRKVAPHDCRWMEWVERRGTCFAAMHGPLWSFEYRAPSTP